MVIYCKDHTLCGQNAKYVVLCYVPLPLFFKWLTRLWQTTYIPVDYTLLKKTVSTQWIIHAVWKGERLSRLFDRQKYGMRRLWPVWSHQILYCVFHGIHLFPRIYRTKFSCVLWSEGASNIIKVFLISNFHHVLYVVCFLLGNTLASEFYMSTFRKTLSVPSS